MTLEIEKLIYEGNGLSCFNGKAVFVPYSVPGDLLEITVTKEKKSVIEGRIHTIVKPGKGRIIPSCPLYGTCGGCQYQHMDYSTQRFWKREILIDVLTRLGDKHLPAALVTETVSSPKEFGYRNGARFRISRDKRIGFLKPSSRVVIPVDSCPLLDERLNKAIPQIESQLTLYGILPEAFDISLNDNGEVESSPVYKGLSEIGFRQKNDGINQHLKELIYNKCSELDCHKTGLLDLFCGDGNLSLNLLNEYKQVKGWDFAEPAVKRGNRKAREWGFNCSPYEVGDLRKIIQSISRYKDDCSCLILDPPRAGLRGIAEEVAGWKIPLVLYVSCVPSHLARDIKSFTENGYKIEEVIPLDMFPQTYHIESLAIFSRKE